MLFLHDQALREYGGMQGIKHEGLLGSALERARNRLAYGGAGVVDLFEMGAGYAFGIAGNHPFHDGNKRTGWACCVLFLKANAVELDAPAALAVERMVCLAAGLLDEAAFAGWLRTVRRG